MMCTDDTNYIKELVKTKFFPFMKQEWSCVVKKFMLTSIDLLEFVNFCVNCLDNPYSNNLDLNNSAESDVKRTSKKKINFTSMISDSTKETGKALSKKW